jgi:hypothetical protein
MTEHQDTGNTPARQPDRFDGPDCHVYVIGFDIKKSPSKVGIASNPLKRMATLQTAHHQRLVLGGSWVLPERDMARALELSFHETQRRSRLAGEWFDLTPEQCMCILHIGLGVMLNVCGGMEPEHIEEVLAFARSEHPESDWWRRGTNG